MNTTLRNRFYAWWKRRLEPDHHYEDRHTLALIKNAAERAYFAGWQAAKAKRRELLR